MSSAAAGLASSPKTGDVSVRQRNGVTVRVVFCPSPFLHLNYQAIAPGLPPAYGVGIEDAYRALLKTACARLDELEAEARIVAGIIEAIEGASLAEIEARRKGARQ